VAFARTLVFEETWRPSPKETAASNHPSSSPPRPPCLAFPSPPSQHRLPPSILNSPPQRSSAWAVARSLLCPLASQRRSLGKFFSDISGPAKNLLPFRPAPHPRRHPLPACGFRRRDHASFCSVSQRRLTCTTAGKSECSFRTSVVYRLVP